MATTKRASSARKKRLLISEVCGRYLRDVEVTREGTTLTSYRYRTGVLIRLLADVCQLQYLDEVEVDHLRQCVQRLSAMDLSNTIGRGRAPENGSTYAVETIRGYVRVWKAFFGWCLQEGLLEKNPADSRFKSPKPEMKVKAAFTEEHIYKMLAVFDTSDPLVGRLPSSLPFSEKKSRLRWKKSRPIVKRSADVSTPKRSHARSLNGGTKFPRTAESFAKPTCGPCHASKSPSGSSQRSELYHGSEDSRL